MNFEKPHRRYNPLTGEWVLVSPHRAKRPWLGQVEKVPPLNLPEYDPQCYLCPGNPRTSGITNPDYQQTYVFDNDFPALLTDSAGDDEPSASPLFRTESETGVCKVVCFSPKHNLSLPEMPVKEIEAVVTTWMEQTNTIKSIPGITNIQIFENKGEMMGCSNPHPHSQIWATGRLPNQTLTESNQQESYLKEHGHCLLCDYVQSEKAEGIRIVASNDQFTALVPFWAVWPFEILLISNRHLSSLPELTQQEITGLADIIQQVTIRYDNLFEISFPYSMGFHQAPFDGHAHSGWHLHAHYYPPLLRSATVRKFMVGFELLGMPQRDLTPETAADRLRQVSGTHYKNR